MLAELGHFALILALPVSLVLGIFPLVGAHRGIHGWITLAKHDENYMSPEVSEALRAANKSQYSHSEAQ